MAKRKAECTPEEWEVQKAMSRERNIKYLESHRSNQDFKERMIRNTNKCRAKVKDAEEFKEKAKIRSKQWYEANKERALNASKAYALANPEKIKAIDAKKYQANKESYKQRARERELSMPSRSLGGKYNKEILALYKEAKRLTEQTGIPHEVDHIIPLNGKNVSGLHVPSNLRIITRSENRRKSNKIEEIYYGTNN